MFCDFIPSQVVTLLKTQPPSDASFDSIASATASAQRHAALESLASDPGESLSMARVLSTPSLIQVFLTGNSEVDCRKFAGLHPLAPYFTKLVADEVSANLRNAPSLHAMLALSSALVSNPHIDLEHYVHQLLPPVLSCLVSKSIGESINHTSKGHTSKGHTSKGHTSRGHTSREHTSRGHTSRAMRQSAVI